MTVYDFPGFLSAMVAFQLVLWGVVVGALAALRWLLVHGQPGRGHVARGFLAGAGVLVLAGVALYAVADFLELKRFMDLYGTPAVAIAALGGGALVGWRVARRGARPSAAPREATPPPPPPSSPSSR